MRFLFEPETTLLKWLRNNSDHTKRETSIETTLDDLELRADSDTHEMIVSFLERLEEEKVLKFANVHLRRGRHGYGDIFLIRFFETLARDEKKAHEMLKIFELEELLSVIEYSGDSLSELLTAIGSVRTKVKRLYFNESDAPFYRQLLDAIVFDFSIDEASLVKFIGAYIGAYMQDELLNVEEVETDYSDEGEEQHMYGVKFYPFKTQRLLMINALEEVSKSQGYTNVFLLNDDVKRSEFREYETVLSAEKEGFIKILNRRDDFSTLVFNIEKKKLGEEFSEYQQEIRNLLRRIHDESSYSPIFDGSSENLKSNYFEKTNVLRISGKDVTLRKTLHATNQTRLLETIFKNPRRRWDADEVYEDWGENPLDFSGKNTLDTARRYVNEKVREQAQLDEDFLEGNNTFVKINAAYL